MDNAHTQIEDVLSCLRDLSRALSKDIERLSEEGLIVEEEDPLYSRVRELRRLTIKIQMLLVSVLSDEYSPATTKALLSQAHVMRLLSNPEYKNSPLATLLRSTAERT